MTARDTYAASLATAEAAKIATLISAETTRQTTIDAQLSVVGYHPGVSTSSSASLESAVAAANKARWAATFNSEHAKQVAINIARDTLRDGGDRLSF